MNKAEYSREWRKRNAAHIAGYVKRNRKKRNAQARKRRGMNPGKAVRASRKWRAKNADKAVQAVREWRQRNPDWNRDYRERNREHFRGDGKWSARSIARRRAFREWVRTMAAGRRAVMPWPPRDDSDPMDKIWTIP